MIISNLQNLRHKKINPKTKAYYTQDEVCEVVGISNAHYRRLERGKFKSVSISMLEKLTDFYDCSVGDILVIK